MTTALPRKPCPTCGKDVAWRTVRGTRLTYGRYGVIPPLRVPVAHKQPLDADGRSPWCPAGVAVR
jgi:hypothetical protein